MPEHDDNNFEQMTFRLPHDLAKAVREAVDGDRFIAPSDVVAQALRTWEISEEIRAKKIERLRALVAEGEASGFELWEPGDAEDIMREGRATLASRNAPE